MPDANSKDALWKALDTLRLKRLTARVALSAGLIGLAAQPASAATSQPRVPVSPDLTPQATVRKFKGRYVLRRVANALTVRFMSHRSHSSHASHASHNSHVSSSHYSSSSPLPTPPPVPVPAPSAPSLPRSPSREAVPPQWVPLLKEDFDESERAELRWSVGVLATAADTFDRSVTTRQAEGLLTIAPAAHKSGAHFSGYVSAETFDLTRVTIVAELRRPAAGGTTIFAAGNDHLNWRGFRLEGGQLTVESHTNGHIAVARKTAYDPSAHRYLRLRTSNVAPVVVWETSADGKSWNPEYVETSTMNLSAVRIALSAGTTKSASPGSAAFDSVVVERKP